MLWASVVIGKCIVVHGSVVWSVVVVMGKCSVIVLHSSVVWSVVVVVFQRREMTEVVWS